MVEGEQHAGIPGMMKTKPNVGQTRRRGHIEIRVGNP
jgi:hypothetical protein